MIKFLIIFAAVDLAMTMDMGMPWGCKALTSCVKWSVSQIEQCIGLELAQFDIEHWDQLDDCTRAYATEDWNKGLLQLEMAKHMAKCIENGSLSDPCPVMTPKLDEDLEKLNEDIESKLKEAQKPLVPPVVDGPLSEPKPEPGPFEDLPKPDLVDPSTDYTTTDYLTTDDPTTEDTDKPGPQVGLPEPGPEPLVDPLVKIELLDEATKERKKRMIDDEYIEYSHEHSSEEQSTSSSSEEKEDDKLGSPCVDLARRNTKKCLSLVKFCRPKAQYCTVCSQMSQLNNRIMEIYANELRIDYVKGCLEKTHHYHQDKIADELSFLMENMK